MMSPLVMLKRRSCVIFHRQKARIDPGPCRPGSANRSLTLRRPLNPAAGLFDRRSGLVTWHDLVDAIEILRIVLAAGLRFTDERGCHELMVALAIIAFVGLQLDVVGELEILQRRRELYRIEGSL